MPVGRGDPGEPVVALPGSPQARAAGCCCSVLANAAYRLGADPEPVPEPDCDLHGDDWGPMCSGERPTR